MPLVAHEEVITDFIEKSKALGFETRKLIMVDQTYGA